MNNFLSNLATEATSICIRLLLALAVLFVGRILIRGLTKQIDKNKWFHKTDDAVRSFGLSFIHIGLYILLAICIVSILGVPMASIAALIASAGVAIGLGFQGALANLAGGIMLIIFKPFKLGDFIEVSGITGTAKEINLFYTVITTADNKRVTIPNGNLMNTNIIDYSANKVRRAELIFTCARTENPSRVQEIIKQTMQKDARVLQQPEPPFASISGATNEAYEFTVRAWCQTTCYLDVYFSLTQQISEALAEAGVQTPAVRVTN